MIRPPVFAALGYYPHTAIEDQRPACLHFKRMTPWFLSKAFRLARSWEIYNPKGRQFIFASFVN